MGFIKSVACKIIYLIEDLICFSLAQAFLLRSLDESLLLGFHHARNFFPHSLAQDIGFSHRKSCQLGGDFHHLLLIDNDALSLFQDRFELRAFIANSLRVVFAFYKFICHSAL